MEEPHRRLGWAAPSGPQPCTDFCCKLLCVYCPGHVGTRGNEGARRLASTGRLPAAGLQLGREEVLRGLRNFVNMFRPELQSVDRLKERGVVEGKRPTFNSPGTMCAQPDLHWHCLESNFWETVQRWARALMGLSEHCNAVIDGNRKAIIISVFVVVAVGVASVAVYT